MQALFALANASILPVRPTNTFADANIYIIHDDRHVIGQRSLLRRFLGGPIVQRQRRDVTILFDSASESIQGGRAGH